MWVIRCIAEVVDVFLLPAKKEDTPEEALKDFRAIVDRETDKGDWYSFPVHWSNCMLMDTSQGLQGSEAIYQTPLPTAAPTSRCLEDLHTTPHLYQVCSHTKLLWEDHQWHPWLCWRWEEWSRRGGCTRKVLPGHQGCAWGSEEWREYCDGAIRSLRHSYSL